MASTIPASSACTSPNSARTLHGLTVMTRSGFVEGGHQLEKLEFALAIAQTKGDEKKSISLRKRIVELGGNVEEPGT